MLGDEAESVPAEQERAEMLQEFWDEGCGAEVDDEAYDWVTDESQISDQEAAPAHDCMQGPTSARGHEEEAKAAATGHEEAQATATGQEKKTAGTGDTGQALSAANTKCHGQENEKQLASAVTGTPLGIAPNATCCTITARMARFVTSSAFLSVAQRRLAMPLERHDLAKCCHLSYNCTYDPRGVHKKSSSSLLMVIIRSIDHHLYDLSPLDIGCRNHLT